MLFHDYNACTHRLEISYKTNVSIDDQPFLNDCTNINLLFHQKRILKKIIDHETNNKPYSTRYYDIDYMMGILADKPGTGKSYIISALLEHKPVLSKSFSTIESYGPVQIKETKTNFKYYGCNLIVAPHYLIEQWISTLNKIPNFVFKLKQKKHIDSFKPHLLSPGSIVILTNTFYDYFTSRFCHILWSRIIYDEADTINISSTIELKSNFVWFVTASVQNLLFPSGYYEQHIVGIKSKGIIKEIFKNLEYSYLNNIFNFLIFKCNDDLLNYSLKFPETKSFIYKADEPIYLKVLNGHLGYNIIQHLNAGDLNGALEKLGPSYKKENIIHITTQKYKNEIFNRNQKIIYIQNSISDPISKYNRVNEQKKVIERLKTKIESIEERININTCPVCYDNIEDSVISNCCNHKICLRCFSQIISNDPKCPMCRSSWNTSSIKVMSEKSSNHFKKHVTTKDDILQNIIKSKGSFILFSSYNIKLNNVHNLFGNSFNIQYLLKKFNSKKIKCLSLNPGQFGNGLNLDSATDVIFYHKMKPLIEEQLIGRVKRIGNNKVINIHYIYYDNELTN